LEIKKKVDFIQEQVEIIEDLKSEFDTSEKRWQE